MNLQAEVAELKKQLEEKEAVIDKLVARLITMGEETADIQLKVRSVMAKVRFLEKKEISKKPVSYFCKVVK